MKTESRWCWGGGQLALTLEYKGEKETESGEEGRQERGEGAWKVNGVTAVKETPPSVEREREKPERCCCLLWLSFTVEDFLSRFNISPELVLE